jgi:hypothetical protein
MPSDFAILLTGAVQGALYPASTSPSRWTTTLSKSSTPANHGVIFFRNQRIAPQQVAFTRRFGTIEFNIFGER